MAAQLKETGAKDVKVAGYTDRLGSDAYNLDLSQRRANRVKARLIQDGVTSEITAVGYGKVPQVKACNGYKHASKAEKDCLRPNRRVEITASGSVLKLQEGRSRKWRYSRSNKTISKIIDIELQTILYSHKSS